MKSIEADFHIKGTNSKARCLLIFDALAHLLNFQLPFYISRGFSSHFTFIFFKDLNLAFFLFNKFLNSLILIRK